MPDLQEVFRMSTQKVKPDPGALGRQHTRQRRRSVGKKVGAFALAAAFVIGAMVVAAGALPEDPPADPAEDPSNVDPVGHTPQQVASDFMEAYGAFDVREVIGWVGPDSDISDLAWGATGPVWRRDGRGGFEENDRFVDRLRLVASLLQAQGYSQVLHPCEELSSSGSPPDPSRPDAILTNLRCPFDFHSLRSDEIGRGPFSGSYFDLTVRTEPGRDGGIVRASISLEIEEFGPEMWDPFTDWVYEAYPEDAAVMYEEPHNLERLTEESIRLWEQRTREYANEVQLGTPGQSVQGLPGDHVVDLDTGAVTPLPGAIIRSLGETAESAQPESHYAVSSNGSLLAYVGTGEEGSPQIFIAGMNGTGIRQVTHDPVGASWPAWSPAGTRIAYEGGGGDSRDLFVLDVASGESTQIADGVADPYAGLQFTPDGSALVYTDRGSASDAAEMRTVPIAGGQGTILFGGGRGGMGAAVNGSFSPDGSLVTMTGHEVDGPGAAVFVSNADGSQRRAIGGYGMNPAGTWSPDGSRIVCLSYSERRILVVDVATGDTSHVARGSEAIWLDDHTLLVEA